MYIKNGTGNKNSLEDNSLAMSVVDHYMYKLKSINTLPTA